MPHSFKWYVVEGIEGRTDICCQRLAMAMAGLDGFELYRPFDIKERASRRGQGGKGGAQKPPPKPLRIARFGRYFFLRCILSDSFYHEIRNAPHVRGFVCQPGSKKPFPVPDAQISFIKDNHAEKPVSGWELHFYRGRRVTVSEGPFKGMTGLVQTIDKRGVLKVDLENKSGSPIPLVIEVGHVLEALELKQSPNASNDVRTRTERVQPAGA